MSRKRIAVVGGSCPGLTAFWALNSFSSHDVHLFEASGRLGGRLRSFSFEHDDFKVSVDTGFIPFKRTASPNFCALLNYLNIKIRSTQDGFSVTDARGDIRWGYHFLMDLVFDQIVPAGVACWRILFDIIRFNYTPIDVLIGRTLDSDHANELRERLTAHSRQNLRDYLNAEGLSADFQERYLKPLLAIFWNSTAVANSLLELPIKTVFRLIHRHGLLDSSALYGSSCELGGAPLCELKNAMIRDVAPEKIHSNSKVVETARDIKHGSIALCTIDGQIHYFDHVVFAVPGESCAQIAQSMLTRTEHKSLEKLRVNRNVAVLHSDRSLMPLNKYFWSSRNYIRRPPPQFKTTQEGLSQKGCITYSLNILQNLPEPIYGPIFVTLNFFTPPYPQHVQAVWEFTDFEIGSETLQARDKLQQQQSSQKSANSRGKHRNISVCGHCWLGHGYYEDGVTTALQVAAGLGANVPFDIVDHNIHDEKVLNVHIPIRDRVVWISLKVLQLYILSIHVLLHLLQWTVSPFKYWLKNKFSRIHFSRQR